MPNERIVAEVVDQQALLRVMLAGPGRPQEAVVLYAAPHDGAGDIGPSLGVQLWADGDAHAEINLCKEHGRWTTETFIED